MTPRFTIRVWGSLGEHADWLNRALGLPRERVAMAEIEIDGIDESAWELTISGHRGLDLIPQKMLT